MFEAKPPRSSESRAFHETSWDGESLRELTWADLVARLSASRDFRGEYEADDLDGEASFDASNARRVAAHHNGKLNINPEDLADSKTDHPTAHSAVHGLGTGYFPGAARK